MKDLISRQAAIDALKGLPTWWADEGGYYGGAQPPMEALLEPEDAISALENLPSAQPERKKGKWINAYPDIEPNPMFMYGICSVCGYEQAISDKLKFCPNCGADMRGEQDG